jgi:hypothetical protein
MVKFSVVGLTLLATLSQVNGQYHCNAGTGSQGLACNRVSHAAETGRYKIRINY